MAGGRNLKVAEAMREELTQLLREDVKDPRLTIDGLMTVSYVEVSGDLGVATVRVSFIGTPEKQVSAALAALERVAGFLRGEIGRRLNMRRAPEIRFVQDKSGEYAAHIDELLKNDSHD